MSANSHTNHYTVLGVAHNATLPEIRSAYKKLALKLHPDKAGDGKETTAKFRKVSEIFIYASYWLTSMKARKNTILIMRTLSRLQKQWIFCRTQSFAASMTNYLIDRLLLIQASRSFGTSLESDLAMQVLLLQIVSIGQADGKPIIVITGVQGLGRNLVPSLETTLTLNLLGGLVIPSLVLPSPVNHHPQGDLISGKNI